MNMRQKIMLKRALALGEKGVGKLANINNQTVLARLAIESESEALACAAAAKVNRPSLLEQIVSDAKTNTARLNAAARITYAKDLLFCLHPLQDNLPQSFYEELVTRLPREVLLDTIFSTNCIPELQHAGMQLLTSKSLVLKTALEYNGQCSYAAAETFLRSLSSEEEIATVAANASNSSIRHGAVKQTTDNRVLEELFSQETDASVLLAIAEQLQEESYFVRVIYKTDNSREVQLQCAQYVAHNEEALVHIVSKHPSWEVFAKLVDKIYSAQNLVKLWKMVDDCDKITGINLGAGDKKNVVFTKLEEHPEVLLALWDACLSDTRHPILRSMQKKGYDDALGILAQKTPDDDLMKPEIICAKDGHDWQPYEETKVFTYFPEGIDPCNENLCFLECEEYQNLGKRCRRCGKIE